LFAGQFFDLVIRKDLLQSGWLPVIGMDQGADIAALGLREPYRAAGMAAYPVAKIVGPPVDDPEGPTLRKIGARGRRTATNGISHWLLLIRRSQLVSGRLGQFDRRSVLQHIAVVEDPAGEAGRLRRDRAEGLERVLDHCLKGVADSVHEPQPG